MIALLFTDKDAAIRCGEWCDRFFGLPKRGVKHYAPVLEHPITHDRWALPIDARAPLNDLRAAFPEAGGPDEIDAAEWIPPPPRPA